MRSPLASLLTASAGAIHLGVAIAHREENAWHVAAFAVAGVAQLVAARWAGPRTMAGANAVLIVAWGASHIAGVGPFSGHAGADVAGVISVLVEIAAMTFALASRERLRVRSADPLFAATAVVAMLAAVASIASSFTTSHPAGASGDGHEHHDPADTDDHQGGHRGGGHGPLTFETLPVSEIEVGDHPTAIASEDGATFVADRQDGTISRIDASTGAVDAFPVGGTPTALALADGVLWMADHASNTVTRLDPTTGARLDEPLAVGRRPAALLATDGVLFVANSADGTISRIEMRADGPQVATSDRVGFGLTRLVDHGGVIYGLATLDATVVRIDPSSLQPIGRPIRVGHGALGLTSAPDGVWVANTSDGTVVRIDPLVGDVVGMAITVDPQATPGLGPVEIVAAGDRILVVNNRTRSILEIDPDTARPSGLAGSYVTGKPVEVGVRGLVATLVQGETLWLTDYLADRVVRVELTPAG